MSNRVVDLVGEGFDLAVRLAPLPDSTLTAIKLGEVRTLHCASPEYLARRGSPATPHDLLGHDCVGMNVEGNAELWAFRMAPGDSGRVRSLRVATRLSLNSAAAAIGAACRGHGVVRVRSYQVTDEIASGRLIALLPPFEPPPAPVHLVFHPDRAGNVMLRAFIEHAVPALRRDLLEAASALSPLKPGRASGKPKR